MTKYPELPKLCWPLSSPPGPIHPSLPYLQHLSSPPDCPAVSFYISTKIKIEMQIRWVGRSTTLAPSVSSAPPAPPAAAASLAGETPKLQPPSPAPDFGRWIADFSAECKQRFLSVPTSMPDIRIFLECKNKNRFYLAAKQQLF